MKLETMVEIFKEEFMHGLTDYDDTEGTHSKKEQFVQATMNKAHIRILTAVLDEKSNIELTDFIGVSFPIIRTPSKDDMQCPSAPEHVWSQWRRTCGASRCTAVQYQLDDVATPQPFGARVDVHCPNFTDGHNLIYAPSFFRDGQWRRIGTCACEFEHEQIVHPNAGPHVL